MKGRTMLVSMFPSGMLAPPVLVAWDALQDLQTNFFSFLLSLLFFTFYKYLAFIQDTFGLVLFT